MLLFGTAILNTNQSEAKLELAPVDQIAIPPLAGVQWIEQCELLLTTLRFPAGMQRSWNRRVG
ncbi:hypothetical protein [Paraburkholderia sp. BL6669N2]|uniref:hypothetical protein n=1 Tax=Paraburkholderia sp. BL6669N2 TaxID=1938807 RepID=UPI0011C02A31|nr:hypothetical protein [Paraburkholderia sp. BL6669N2]